MNVQAAAAATTKTSIAVNNTRKNGNKRNLPRLPNERNGKRGKVTSFMLDLLWVYRQSEIDAPGECANRVFCSQIIPTFTGRRTIGVQAHRKSEMMCGRRYAGFQMLSMKTRSAYFFAR